MKQLRPALLVFVFMTVLTGVAYPLVVTAISQVVFPRQANGSLVVKDGKVVGSALIGQPFDDPKYFWSRPSATAPVGYNGAVSSGSNQGPLSDALMDAVRGRIDALKAADPGNRLPIPVDLITASGSGLDPNISPAAAQYQAARVARERRVAEPTVRALVGRYTYGRQLGVLGEPVVDVLALNLALDRLEGK